MAAGGGIIRDYKGSALVAFSTFYGPGTNTFAEARAPLFGLMLCYRLGYSKVAVESEKKRIFDSICGGAVPWTVLL